MMISCALMTLASCSAIGRRINVAAPRRPDLSPVVVQNCREDDNDVRWCEVDIATVLINDAKIKAHVRKLEAYFN